MRRANPTSARSGFTLIELLVVMMIIALLLSLSLAAWFGVRESTMRSYSEALIQKLASALDQQWKAAVDQIREEPVPAWAMSMGGNDPRVAKVVYLKARLKQEFPVSFYEAYYPYANYTPLTNGTPQTAQTNLPPKPAFLRALAPLVGNYIPATVSQQIPPVDKGMPLGFESSALLYLALSQGRRGQVGFNPDDNVEPTAIQTATVNGVQFKYFVDSWGNPVRYWAFPYNNAELNAPPYLQNSKNGQITTQNQQSPDPQDAEAALPTVPLNTPSAFVNMVHPLNYGQRMLIPVVGSAGKDGLWGVDEFLMTPMPSPPQPSEPALGYDARANDNIYSYRLRRSGARGD